MHADDSVLKELWRVETEILNVFDSLCSKHRIRYSLGYGSLLGAVRNKGFIPWDDDIDIIMERSEYDRFIDIWKHESIRGFILQTEYDTISEESDTFGGNFCKIRKDHTTFLQHEIEKSQKYHKGIFIDIFPADRVAPSSLLRRCQFIASMVYMLFCRNYADEDQTGIIGVGQKLLLALPLKTKHKISKKAFSFMTRWNNETNCLFVVPCTLPFCKIYFPSNLFDSTDLMQFNDKKYSCIKAYDQFLKIMYGDYMTLPPPEERVWKHHPLIIDFDHNYEDIVEAKA